jgi:hypothetical protein
MHFRIAVEFVLKILHASRFYYKTYLIKSIQRLTVDFRFHVESDGTMVVLVTRHDALLARFYGHSNQCEE